MRAGVSPPCLILADDLKPPCSLILGAECRKSAVQLDMVLGVKNCPSSWLTLMTYVLTFEIKQSLLRASRVVQWVKKLPAMEETQEIWVRFLGWEDPLEEVRTTHSSILAWRIPWTEEPGGLQSTGHEDTDEVTEHAQIMLIPP